MRKLFIVLILSTVFGLTSSTFMKAEDFSVPVSETGEVSVPPVRNHSYVAIYTNLLYDAVLVPNLGVEVNFYDNWTVYGDLMRADWNMPAKHFYWNLFGAQVGARKYFGRLASERSFSGHHAGVYGQALAYDLQAGNLGQQTPIINWGGGIEYGYSFPIALNFNIDVALGVGYIGGKYYEYVVHEDHYTWRGTVARAWFGPTKASVSLVWLIKSRKYTNR